MVIEVKQNGKFVKIPYITADVPVSEAPIDGKQYARQDATWSEIVIPEVDLTEVEANIAANTQAIAANTADIATLNSTVSNLPTAESIVVTTDPRLTAATTTKAGLMTAADKVQLDSTLTATEIENKVNAAVSSVYRVKGNVATVSNLPTSNVAIGDVYNITDSGANYVAVNNNPVEWDKLSETVDLAPYMQTSTANSTFVKKSGDTMTGTLNVTNDGKIAIANGTINSFANEGSTGKFYRFVKGDNVEAGSFGWDANGMYIYNFNRRNRLYYKDNGDLTFENVPVALTYGTKIITVAMDGDTNRRAIHNHSGISIIPDDGSNATGLNWRNQADTKTLSQIGTFTIGDNEDAVYTFMGWNEGDGPWAYANNLTVGKNKFTYKNNNIWHAGNDGAGSGLDADTVDGIQAAGFCKYNTSIVASEFTGNDFGYGYKTNGWYTSGPAWSIGDSSGNHAYIKQFQGNANTNVLHMRTISDNVASSWREFAFKDDNVVLTQAEYNALGSTVNSDGKIYFIKE